MDLRFRQQVAGTPGTVFSAHLTHTHTQTLEHGPWVLCGGWRSHLQSSTQWVTKPTLQELLPFWPQLEVLVFGAN